MKKVILSIIFSLFFLTLCISRSYCADIENLYTIENEKYLCYIAPETTSKGFKKNINSQGSDKIYNDNIEVADDEYVGTGMVLKTDDNKNYTLSVLGDITGDGKITSTDVLNAKKISVELILPDIAQTYAIDLNYDSDITSTDILPLAKYQVEIIDSILTAKDILLEKENYEVDLSVSNSISINAKTMPKVISQIITYESKNKEIADVTSQGVIIPKSNGTSEIIIRDTINDLEKKCTVEVKTSPTNLTVAENNVRIKMGETSTYQINATIEPSTANTKTNITYRSSDESIAKVSPDGLVTLIKNGKVTITAETENGKTADVIISTGFNIDGIPGQIADFFYEKGVSLVGIAALLGNAQCESNFDPTCANSVPCVGLWQFNLNYDTLEEFARERGTDWTDVETQMEFLWYHLTGDVPGRNFSKASDAIFNHTDPSELDWVTWAFARYYEQPWLLSQKPDWNENGPRLAANRINAARNWYTKLTN